MSVLIAANQKLSSSLKCSLSFYPSFWLAYLFAFENLSFYICFTFFSQGFYFFAVFSLVTCNSLFDEESSCLLVNLSPTQNLKRVFNLYKYNVIYLLSMRNYMYLMVNSSLDWWFGILLITHLTNCGNPKIPSHRPKLPINHLAIFCDLFPFQHVHFKPL